MHSKYIKNSNGMFFPRKRKGFSFLEVMISLFIFALMMTTISMIFASLFKNYKRARTVQINLENAQFTMNSMAKALRTSSIIDPTSPGTVSSIRFFNYSDGTCVSYRLQGNSLQAAIDTYPGTDQTSGAKKTWCSSEANLSNYSNLTSSFVNDVRFGVIPSSEGTGGEAESYYSVVGKVTILIEVCESFGCPESQDKAKIQTTVSLRDYNTVGL